MQPLLVTFAAGSAGPWVIDRVLPVIGDTLALAQRLDVREATSERPTSVAPEPTWSLRGVVSNIRYSMRHELGTLAGAQAGLARPAATRAALIPIRKSPAWWALAQDERRAIFEEQSRHITIGMEALPAVARRLHHSRDLGEAFDFLTWFEFAPEDEPAFETMLSRLRASAEWGYIEREVDVRLTRAAA